MPPDLTVAPPRSPRVERGGLITYARTLGKAHARSARTAYLLERYSV
jgi:hypothetical protein